MKIDPVNGVVESVEADVQPSGDVDGAVDDQALDSTTSSEHVEGDDDSTPASSDADDDLIDSSDAPPGAEDWVKRTNKTVQRRLREASTARKEAQELREQVAVLKAQQEGFANVMRSKDPNAVLGFLREQFGVDASQANDSRSQPTFQFKATKPLSDVDAQKALEEQFTDLGTQLMAAMTAKFQEIQRPIVEKVKASESVVRDRAWGKVVEEYGPNVAKYREKYEALVERGMPSTEAIMAASAGAAYAEKLKRAQAAQKAKGASTPTLPPRGRAPVGATPVMQGRRSLSAYFNKAGKL